MVEEVGVLRVKELSVLLRSRFYVKLKEVKEVEVKRVGFVVLGNRLNVVIGELTSE